MTLVPLKDESFSAMVDDIRQISTILEKVRLFATKHPELLFQANTGNPIEWTRKLMKWTKEVDAEYDHLKARADKITRLASAASAELDDGSENKTTSDRPKGRGKNAKRTR